MILIFINYKIKMDLFDIRRNILLCSDIETLNNLRSVDKLSLEIINNHFWIDKFNYDKLLLFKDNINNIKEWVNEYNYMRNIQNDVNLILTTNIIETEVYKDVTKNKIRIMCDVKEVEDIMSNIDSFKFDSFIRTIINNDEIHDINLSDDHKIHNIEGHIKIELIDNKYDIYYSIYKRSTNGSYYVDEYYFDLSFMSRCNYKKIEHLLTKSLYKELRIQDWSRTDYLFVGDNGYQSNSNIVSKVINIKKDHELLELANTPSKTIMLINYIENELHETHIKNINNIFTFENVKHQDLTSQLSKLLPIEFCVDIHETINKINSRYLYSNISIIASTPIVECTIRIYLDERISYKTKIQKIYDHHIISDILTKSINSGFKILDYEGHNIYCDNCSYEDDISLNRTIMRRAIELLY